MCPANGIKSLINSTCRYTALVKWIKYTDTEVSEAGNVRVMLKDKQNLQKRLNAFLYWRWVLLALEAKQNEGIWSRRCWSPGEGKILSAKLIHLPVLNILVKCIRKWENKHRCNYWAQKTKIRYRKKKKITDLVTLYSMHTSISRHVNYNIINMILGPCDITNHVTLSTTISYSYMMLGPCYKIIYNILK